MAGKERLSVSIDPVYAAEAKRAVAEGRAESVSAWVSAALRKYSEHEARLEALQRFIDDWEAEFGPITEEQMAESERELRSRAIVVNAPGSRQQQT